MRDDGHIDELDKMILNILQEDGRASYSEIARRLKVPESTVRLRVRSSSRGALSESSRH